MGDDFYLAKLLDGLGPINVVEGGSGYFSKPDTHLDPRLFLPTNSLRGEVRQWLLSTLYDYWQTRWNAPESWSTVWIAGSGICYQWAADRSNGDLDILIGIHWSRFYQSNPETQGLSETELCDVINNDLRTNLWSKTGSTLIGTQGEPNGSDVGEFSGIFEVTFYCNPRSTDIRDIHPYAAYDLSHNRWTVTPPVLPDDTESIYPKAYWDTVHAERAQATGLVERYNHLANSLAVQHPTTPGWSNTMSQMGLVVDQANHLFDDIHLGRKNAFGPDGQGYGDFYNFRWQAHKRFGTIAALSSLAQARKGAKDAMERATYGVPLKNAEQALTDAALWNTPYRKKA